MPKPAVQVSAPGARPTVKPKYHPKSMQFKAHKVLATLDGWATPGVGLSAKEISGICELSMRDLGRILNRLSEERRVSRSKSKDNPNAYFRYWITPEQRKRFYRQVSGGWAAPSDKPKKVVAGGDAEIDLMQSTKLRLLSSLDDIAAEKRRLNEEIASIREKLDEGLVELDDARAHLAKLRSDANKNQRDIREAKKQSQQTRRKKDVQLAELGSLLHSSPSRSSALTGVTINPMELSECLRFIKGLRERPALTDLHLLKVVQSHYEDALKAVTKD